MKKRMREKEKSRKKMRDCVCVMDKKRDIEKERHTDWKTVRQRKGARQWGRKKENLIGNEGKSNGRVFLIIAI